MRWDRTALTTSRQKCSVNAPTFSKVVSRAGSQGPTEIDQRFFVSVRVQFDLRALAPEMGTALRVSTLAVALR